MADVERSGARADERAFHDYLERVEAGRAVDARRMAEALPPDVREAFLRRVDDYEAVHRSPSERLPELSPGRTLGGYRLVRELGRGGMGVVWEAEELALARPVALKLLSPAYSVSPEALARFRREAEAAGRLSHPNLVAVHAVGEADGLHYIAQELVRGGRTLCDWIAAARAELAADHDRRVAELFVELADALGAAHAQGVVHRDVKPGNVLLTEDGEPKLTDFGLAKLEGDLSLSRTGAVLGTPYYMSPEQVLGRRDELDGRSDVFALGATLYECLALARAFEGDTGEQVVHKILDADPPDPRTARSRVPADLALICLKALEKRPQDRYASMAELADDLRRFLAHEPIRARRPSRLLRARKWTRRHPGRAAALGVAGVVLPVVGYLWATVYLTRDEVAASRSRERLARAERLLVSGFFELNEGEPSRALAAFESALELDPGSAEALAGRALTLVRTGETDAAFALLGERGPDDDVLALVREICLNRAGRPRQAEEVAATSPEARTHLAHFLVGMQFMHGPSEGDAGQAHERLLLANLTSPEARDVYQVEYLHSLGHMERGAVRPRHVYLSLLDRLEDPDLLFATHLYGGMALGAAGEVEGGLEALRAALELRPDDASVHRRLGLLLRDAGDDDGAARAFRAAIDLDPSYSLAHASLGQLHLDAGEHEAAADAFGAAARLAPEDPEAWNGLGAALAGAARGDEAEAAYRRALELEPGHRYAGENLGRLLRRTGELDGALAVLGPFVRQRPDAPDGWYELGRVHEERGDAAAAEATYRTLARRWPDDARAPHRLGHVREARDETEAALALYRRAIELGPGEPEPYEDAGRVLVALGRHAEAVEAWRRRARMQPESSLAYWNLGWSLFQLGRYDGAEFALGAAVRMRPDDPHVRVDLAQVLAARGNHQEAVLVLREARALDPDDPHTLRALGKRLFLDLGETDEAREAYEAALAAEPDDAWTHNALGHLLSETGDSEGAREHFRAAVRCDPGFALAWTNLGIALNTAGAHDEARAALERAIELDPENGELYRYLGWGLARSGAQAEAVAAYERSVELDPELPMAWCDLAYALADAGRLNEAVDAVREGHRLAQADPDWPHDSAAWVDELESRRGAR